MTSPACFSTAYDHEIDLLKDTKIESVTLFHDRALLSRTFQFPRSQFPRNGKARVTVRAPESFLNDIFPSSLRVDVYCETSVENSADDVAIIDQFIKTYNPHGNNNDDDDDNDTKESLKQQALRHKQIKQRLKSEREAQLKAQITDLKHHIDQLFCRLRVVRECKHTLNQSVIPQSPNCVTYNGHKTSNTGDDNDDEQDGDEDGEDGEEKIPHPKELVSVTSLSQFRAYLTQFTKSVQSVDEDRLSIQNEMKTKQSELEKCTVEWKKLKEQRTKEFEKELQRTERAVRIGVVLDFSSKLQQREQQQQQDGDDVDVDADQILFHVHYQAKKCRWSPLYDVRLLSQHAHVSVQYMAMICQQTGEDWSKLNALYLTTVDPTQCSAPQLIEPQTLNLSHMDKYRSSGGGGFFSSVFRLFGSRAYNDPVPRWVQNVATKTNTGTNTKPAHFLFKIKSITSVPSDGNEHKVLLDTLTFFQFETYHYCVPKKTNDVFMSLKIKNTSEMPIMDGKMNMFDGNHSIGFYDLPQSVNIGEEFEVYMGVDPGVRLEYLSPKRFMSEKPKSLFNRSKVKKCEVERRIVIKNNRAGAIRIHVEDQVPRSETKDIEIELLQPSKVKTKDESNLAPNMQNVTCLNEKNNLEWINWTIQPKQTEQFTIKYSVQWSEHVKLDPNIL